MKSPTLNDVSRVSVLKAIGEYDELGHTAFLQKYGFGNSRSYFLSYDGKLYSSKAIIGVAFGYEFSQRGALQWDEFSGGDKEVKRPLETLGFSVVVNPGQRPSLEHELKDRVQYEERNGAFDPDDEIDGRDRVFAEIVRRRGQLTFRKKLIEIYEGRCAITGCSVEAVLEAAHVRPYKGDHTNHPTNGILLRADLHTLFDLHLITIDETTMTVLIARDLKGTDYEVFEGKPVFIPADRDTKPSKEAIMLHRQEMRIDVRA